MTERTFCWVQGLRGPEPQILFNPRVGCGSTKIIPGTERELSPNDGRSLRELAEEYDAPKEASCL